MELLVPTCGSRRVASSRTNSASCEPPARTTSSDGFYEPQLHQRIAERCRKHLYPEHVRKLSIYGKRDQRHRIDQEWHDQLAAKVRQARQSRVRGNTRLQNLQMKVTGAIGLNPRIYRE